MTPTEVSNLIRMNPHTTVWGYLRVSSGKQATEGEGLESQKHAILQFCKAKGLSPPVFIEEVASATKQMFVPNLKTGQTEDSNDRPLLMVLMGHLTDSPGSMLVVWSIDRLSRTVTDQELLLNLLWKNDVKVYSTMAGEADILDGSNLSPDRNLYRVILSAFKQYEAKAIQARMWAGLVRKGSVGGFTGGRPPLGYTTKDGELVISPYEAQMVRYIFFLRWKHCLSIRDIRSKILEGKSADDPAAYSVSVVHNVIRREPMYRQGIYTDFFGVTHNRPDLIIVPQTVAELEPLVLSPEYKALT